MPLPAALDRRFEAIVFDWDGTAVPDRRADATAVRALIEELCAHGLDVALVSGTHVGNVDGQLCARPEGPGQLHLLLNRGSEAFLVGARGPELVERRDATPREDAALTQATQDTVRALQRRGLVCEIVSARPNRRKIDLIPEPAWADPAKAQLPALHRAVEARLADARVRGLAEAVAIALRAAEDVGLADARVTSDAKHVEIGLTDKSDSARWIFARLRRRGLAPVQVAVGGDEWGALGGLPGSDSLLLVPEAAGAAAFSVGPEPAGVPAGVVRLCGGPEALLAVLSDQLRRRRERAVPDVPREPGWHLSIDGVDPELERAHETLLAICDGRLGTSGSPVAEHEGATPSVFAAGVYTGDGPATELLPGPWWTLLPWRLEDDRTLRRVLDFRTGLMRQEVAGRGGRVEALLFSSFLRPGTAVVRAEGPDAGVHPDAAPLRTPPGADAEVAHGDDGTACVRLSGRPLAGIAACALETSRAAPGGRRSLERLAGYRGDAERAPTRRDAREVVRSAEQAGFERLLVEHREAWASRWEDADVVVEGDEAVQLAVRFALHHLIGCAAVDGEAAVGARGLTGPAYRGHVFWDSDVFVLPFLAATCAPAARALLEYRVRRLPAARAAAAERGYAGARFPWESAASGRDVTPTDAIDRTGARVRILTGEEEEHIVSDVAWATACYLDWAGDEAFAAGPGRELLVETARYVASRVRVDSDGVGHIDAVIGPDEYHETVSDNAFTNVMARWNLRRAAGMAGVDPAEAERWRAIAACLADGYEPATRLYEQFAGFFALEPLVIADLAPRRPVAADILLGHERVRAAQVIKQADVLMLHHLVPEETATGSLGPNLAFYEPRTAHGSSLSPGIHASLLARAGRLDEAVSLVRLAGRIDLDDLTGTTAGGLHLATMGSLWQAIVWGFLGVRPAGPRLAVDPVLPECWRALEARVVFRGASVRLRVEPGVLSVWARPGVDLAFGKELAAASAGPDGLRIPLR